MKKKLKLEELPEILDPNIVGEYFGVCSSSVRTMCKLGVLGYVKIGKKFKIPKQALINFLNKNKEEVK